MIAAELRAIADALEWAHKVQGCGVPARIAELRVQAAAVPEVEPVAWIEHHKAGDNLNWEQVDHAYAKATPLYAHPDPRIAELEGLLRDIINDRTSPYDISDEMYGRIEAALGGK